MAHRHRQRRNWQETAVPVVFGLLLILISEAGPYLLGSAGEGSAARLAALQQQLAKVPLVLGDWQGRPEEVVLQEGLPEETNDAESSGEKPAGPRAERFPGVVTLGYVFRRDDNRDRIHVRLVVGPWRSLYRHTPAEFYPGSGFYPERPEVVHEVDAATWRTPLATTTFLKDDPKSSQRYRVWWSYAVDGDRWSLPGWLGRFSASQPVVKLYLIHEERIPQAPSASLGADLATVLMPQWAAAIFPSEAPPPADPPDPSSPRDKGP